MVNGLDKKRKGNGQRTFSYEYKLYNKKSNLFSEFLENGKQLFIRRR